MIDAVFYTTIRCQTLIFSIAVHCLILSTCGGPKTGMSLSTMVFCSAYLFFESTYTVLIRVVLLWCYRWKTPSKKIKLLELRIILILALNYNQGKLLDIYLKGPYFKSNRNCGRLIILWCCFIGLIGLMIPKHQTMQQTQTKYQILGIYQIPPSK